MTKQKNDGERRNPKKEKNLFARIKNKKKKKKSLRSKKKKKKKKKTNLVSRSFTVPRHIFHVPPSLSTGRMKRERRTMQFTQATAVVSSRNGRDFTLVATSVLR